MRKAGVKELDAPNRLVICHYLAHLQFVHGGQMGRPKWTAGSDTHINYVKAQEAVRRFGIVEQSPANAENGEQVAWSAQDRDDLDRLMGGL